MLMSRDLGFPSAVQHVDFEHFIARNLYQLNANEVPLTLHYGFEGRIIILHKNPYRWRLQNDAKGHGNELQ